MKDIYQAYSHLFQSVLCMLKRQKYHIFVKVTTTQHNRDQHLGPLEKDAFIRFSLFQYNRALKVIMFHLVVRHLYRHYRVMLKR